MERKTIHFIGKISMESNDLIERLNEIDLTNPYSMVAAEKKSFLLSLMHDLISFHYENCSSYRNFTTLFPNFHKNPKNLYEMPALPVRMFKQHDLLSMDRSLIFKTLNSSGTSGQSVSRIYLDAVTAKRQSKILSAITKNFIGESRLPMVIIDSNELFKDRTKLNARAAGILGYSVFGRKHFYCLDKDLTLLAEDLAVFLEKHNNGPILIFGFTFIIWQSLLQQAIKKNLKFNFGSQSILIHGGGWKKLEDQKVSNLAFKQSLKENLGISQVHNYYGMVEQVGSVFMECDHGYLHCPNYADVIIRNPLDLQVAPHNKEGVIQVLSVLPVSYPGHSLLTEDLGTVHGEDDCACGRKGKYFTVSGRLPMAELRGCSDTRVTKL
jgi:phenylacetate-coenzyme A ligase PaaK-like adenylate-forming protein